MCVGETIYFSINLLLKNIRVASNLLFHLLQILYPLMLVYCGEIKNIFATDSFNDKTFSQSIGQLSMHIKNVV